MLTAILSASCDKKKAETAQPAAPVEYPLRMSFLFKDGNWSTTLFEYVVDDFTHVLKFDKARFLISNIRVLDASNNVLRAFDDQVILVDMANGEYHSYEVGPMVNGHIQKVTFDVGLSPNVDQLDPSQFSVAPLSDATLWVNSASGHKFLTLEGHWDSDYDNLVETSDQPFTYQCLTAPMVRHCEIVVDVEVHNGPKTIDLTVQLQDVINGVNFATSSAIGATSLNAALMNNMPNSITAY